MNHRRIDRIPPQYTRRHCPECTTLMWHQSSDGTVYDTCLSCGRVEMVRRYAADGPISHEVDPQATNGG
jgi:RNase P subunit RPR2